jgi:ABC-2 type transport system permease protein
MGWLRLLWLFFRIGFMNELAYRANFYMQFIQSLLNVGVALASLAVIFEHTNDLNGWEPAQLVALLGVYFLMSGVIGTLIQPNMQRLMEGVQSGTLDFTLTKPDDAQLLISIGEIRVWRLIDVFQGSIVLFIAIWHLGGEISLWQAASFLLTLVTGIGIVYSFWLMLATLSFWLVRVDNILVIFQSLYEAGRWPIGMYPRWLRATLTFVVPIAFAITVPAQALIGTLSAETLLGSVILSVLMLVCARMFWLQGIRNYSGASA